MWPAAKRGLRINGLSPPNGPSTPLVHKLADKVLHRAAAVPGVGGGGHRAGRPDGWLARDAISRWCAVADRKLAVLGGGLGERFLHCALAAGLAGNRQLRGPGGNAADECCGALAARDLDRCTLTELSEQPGAVLLW